jgi:hypothetical protein
VGNDRAICVSKDPLLEVSSVDSTAPPSTASAHNNDSSNAASTTTTAATNNDNNNNNNSDTSDTGAGKEDGRQECRLLCLCVNFAFLL